MSVLLDPPAAHAATGDHTLPAAVRARVWLVLAAYNEGRAMADVIHGAIGLYPNLVVVDDGSRDDTAAVALAAGATVLRHPINRGQGAALQTGITFALQRGAEFIVTFDSDGQHRVEDVAGLVQPILEGRADICLGSRFLGRALNMPAGRRVLLKAAVLFTRVMSRVKITDTHNGLRCFSRRAAERIRITLDRMAHASELIDQIRSTGLRYQEVPVTIRYTDHSLAKGQRNLGAVRILLDYIVGRLT